MAQKARQFHEMLEMSVSGVTNMRIYDSQQGIYRPNCILFTYKFQTPVYHRDSYF